MKDLFYVISNQVHFVIGIFLIILGYLAVVFYGYVTLLLFVGAAMGGLSNPTIPGDILILILILHILYIASYTFIPIAIFIISRRIIKKAKTEHESVARAYIFSYLLLLVEILYFSLHFVLVVNPFGWGD